MVQSLTDIVSVHCSKIACPAGSPTFILFPSTETVVTPSLYALCACSIALLESSTNLVISSGFNPNSFE